MRVPPAPRWAPTWRPETSKNICLRVLLQKREFIPRRTKKRNNNTELPEINHYFNQHHSSLVRHVKATSRKSLEIQA